MNTKHSHSTTQGVINLSSLTLDIHTLSLLNRGLTFIPSTNNVKLQCVRSELKENIRKFRVKDFFINNSHLDKEPLTNNFSTFKLPSTWTPMAAQNTTSTLDMILDMDDVLALESSRFLHKTNKYIHCNNTDNLSKEERAALNRLKENDDIILKPADKGSSVVIMDKAQYFIECYRQLNDTNYYQKLKEPVFLNQIPVLSNIVNRLKHAKFITDKQKEFLLPNHKPRKRIFYLLPKIHKPITDWTVPNQMPKGRPIVSDCSSESNNLSAYIESYLAKISNKHPSYIKDTYDFISKILDKVIPVNSLFVTFDVTSLYTNMNLNRSIAVVKQFFKLYPDDTRPDELLLQALENILKHSDFEFNNETFIQTTGIAMGKRFAPSLANLYLTHLDDIILEGYLDDFGNITKPLFFYRFIDDGFLIWPSTEELLVKFCAVLNNIIPGITLTTHISKTHVEFLDTIVYSYFGLNNLRHLTNNIFFKPTNSHQLLHKQSYHPKHTSSGVLKSQFLRFTRLCHTKFEYKLACKTLISALSSRGYTLKELKKLQRKTWAEKSNVHSKTKSMNLIPIIFTYNNFNTVLAHQIKSMIRKNLVFRNYNPLVAYKNNRSLRNLLVRSKNW